MSSVDNRIVNMEFNNKQFTQGVNQTEKDLTGLEKAIANTGKSKGLTNLGGAAQQVTAKFSALQVAGVAALATIVSKATAAGLNMLKSFTLAPLMQGFDEYNTNLKSIQTVVANTGASVNTVNGYMQQLNQYSDKTIYNFSEMAKNIGTFTAAGVGLKDSVASIQGISNFAALSGSSSQQASQAMYQLSQAIAAGRVGLQDWNSVVNAGMGGKNLQKALITTGMAMGQINEKVDLSAKTLKIAGSSFRESISTVGGKSSWLTSDVLVKTLSLMDGRLSKASISADHLGWSQKRVTKAIEEQQAALKKQGYSDKQIQDITKMADAAYESATVVKTLPQLLGVVKESLGSVWAQAFTGIIGNFNQSKKLWTSVSNAAGTQVRAFGHTLNKTIAGWNRNGGRPAVIEGFKSGFIALGKVLGTIKDAFRDIFPPATGKDLANLSKNFAAFMQNLIPAKSTLETIGRIFRGLFAAISIGWQIIKGFAGVIGDLIGEMSGGAGGFLEFAASIGDMLVAFDQALKNGDGLENFFAGLTKVLSVPVKMLNAVAEAVFGLFGGFDEAAGAAVEGTVNRVGDRLEPIASFASKAQAAMANLFGSLANLMDPVIEAFANFGTALGKAFTSGSFSPVFDAINTGLLGGITFLLYKFFKDGLNLNLGVGGSGGLFSSITEAFGSLTGTMEAMQTKLKADALLRIAAAIALMTVSIVALSLIDSNKLTSALVAMSVGFGILLGTMAILEKISSSTGFVKMPFISASMILLATAILVLSAAVTVMSALSWEELARGLTGVAGVLAAVALGMRLMPKGMVLQAAALMGIAVALNALALAVRLMSTLTWEEIGKGVATIAGALTAIAVAMRLMPKGILLQAAALFILAGALDSIGSAIEQMGGLSWEVIGKGIATLAGALAGIAVAMHLMPSGMLLQAAALFILGEALKSIGDVIADLGNLSWEQIGKGIAGIAGALALIAIAMQLMPVSLPITAAGLVLVSFALKGIAEVLMSLSGMSWDDMAHGLVALGGALAVIAAGVTLMSGALAGAAALLLVSAALAILAPVLITLGGLSYETIVKGLGALAAAFLLLGAAGYFLGPSILVLGAGMLLLGAGLALAGAGMLAFSTGFALLTATGVAGVAVLMGAIDAFIQKMPEIAGGVAAAFVAFLVEMGKAAPKIRKAMGQIIDNLLGVVEDAAPQIGDLLTVLIDTGLGVLEKGVPRYARAGLRIILGFLDALGDEIPKIVDKAEQLVEKFIKAVGDNTVKLANAGADMLVDVLNGLADAVNKKGPEIRAAARNLASAFVEQLKQALAEMVPNIPMPDLPSPKGLVGKALGSLTGRGRVGAGAGRGGKPQLTPEQKFIKGMADFGKVFSDTLTNVANVVSKASELLVGASSGTAFNFAQEAAGYQKQATISRTRADLQADSSSRAMDLADDRLSKAQDKKNKTAAQKKARKQAIAKAKTQKKAAQQQVASANRMSAAADRQQALADERAQQARDEAAYKNADAQGKGDIRSQQGQDLAARAQDALATAQAKAAEAARLEKLASKKGTSNDEAKRLRAQAAALRKQAASEAAAAQTLSERAFAAQDDAIKQYAEARKVSAKSVIDRMNDIRQQLADEQAARDWQKKYDEAQAKGDTGTMIQMLSDRATASEQQAQTAREALNAAYKVSDDLNAALAADPNKVVSEAELAAVNAAISEAEKQSQIASDAAASAASDRQQIEQLKQQGETATASAGQGGNITPSRTALEDAALAVDRYTTSVAQAEEAAAAGSGAPQFIQNNYSPVALSTSEIYRQSKNLVSTAEVKMGVGTE